MCLCFNFFNNLTIFKCIRNQSEFVQKFFCDSFLFSSQNEIILLNFCDRTREIDVKSVVNHIFAKRFLILDARDVNDRDVIILDAREIDVNNVTCHIVAKKFLIFDVRDINDNDVINHIVAKRYLIRRHN